MTGGSPIDQNTIYNLLGDEQRRQLLYILSHSKYVTVEDLARDLAAIADGVSRRAVSDETVDQIGITLVHDHLPRLEDHGLCEFDARSGHVVAADEIKHIQPFLETILPFDTQTNHPHRTQLSLLYSEPLAGRFLIDEFEH